MYGSGLPCLVLDRGASTLARWKHGRQLGDQNKLTSHISYCFQEEAIVDVEEVKFMMSLVITNYIYKVH